MLVTLTIANSKCNEMVLLHTHTANWIQHSLKNTIYEVRGGRIVVTDLSESVLDLVTQFRGHLMIDAHRNSSSQSGQLR